MLCLGLYTLAPVGLIAQEEEEEYLMNPHFEKETSNGDVDIGSEMQFSLSIASSGFVVGIGKLWKFKPFTHMGVTLDFGWAKGQDEFVDAFGNTINPENVLIFPATFVLKRRILANSIVASMRPYAYVGAGIAAALYAGGDVQKPDDHKDFQIGPQGLFGIGIDFGKPGSGGYGFKVQYQIIRFANHIGERDTFDNLQLGFALRF